MPVENTHAFENKVSAMLSKVKGVNVGGGTDKVNPKYTTKIKWGINDIEQGHIVRDTGEKEYLKKIQELMNLSRK
ncbi:hypothetical protein B5V88_15455 [Heyndrickxia sporothermodurans]|uniref:Uncharacterized protein n=1 Tax=Heyndrickxia sporothermodurans TaxID=46224 RepID=A0AB37HP88_9BACI|nr:hypothetical protein [Heyndrickxia sporothermodurans]MBL5767777.1 hypothetical protein [Heyndrickxia sporothermodurans]MBL5771283.1 hypothetical protein [Heyndrickxia sporothermodurans]MBL5774368.1 hypothetical protein [Heyndrickxia sporothermodurans]MBL5778350.1 hypothetical protein [Heyndrickxia sporothermodurans]MBL5782626.1 hypothetical protein [Heyndrickxia sporothermodurans]